MTRLEIFQRLRDIVDSSGVDDAPELVAYCDSQIYSLSSTHKSKETKAKELQVMLNDYTKCIFQILSEEDFICLDMVMKKLYETFPSKTFNKFYVTRALTKMFERNIIERMSKDFQDPYTLKIKNTRGYRLVRGVKLL